MQLSLAVIYTQLIVSSDIAPASTATVGKMKNGKMNSSMFSLRLFLQCQILPCFLSSTKRHLSHLINKTLLRYNMWCYYFQTFHKEILHDRRIQDTFSSCNFSANSYFSHASYIIHFPILMPCYSKNL